MMKVVIAVALGVALSAGIGGAQPARKAPPAKAPAPSMPTPAGAGSGSGTLEKAGTNEGLGHGTGDRPWAVGVPADKQAAALRAFQDGNVALNDGLFPQAVEKYRDALASWDHPAIHYNMALALMNLDQPIEVEDSLQRSIKYGAAPLEKDKYEHAREYLLLVEKQLANVEVSCNKDGARVSIDAKQVFVVEKGAPNLYKGRVRIGKHTFVAEKPGYATPVDAPFIGPGETFRIELKLYTAEELTRHKRLWPRATWAPWVVIGGGAAIGIAGGLLQWSAKGSYDDFDQQVSRCADTADASCDAASFRDLRDSGDRKRVLGYVGYSIAGAAVITGGLLLYFNRRVAYQITTDEYRMEELHKQPAVTLAPLVGPGLGGAVITGAF